jgi:hypothetical protein
MHLVYIDEVKHDPVTQPYHWLCALAFPEFCLQVVDGALSILAEHYFGSGLLSAETEFHGKDIFQGKGPYKGRPLCERVDLYKSLIEIMASEPGIGRIEIRIDPSRMVASTYQDMAFMFLVEKVDDYMGQEDSLALLIADEDRELATSNVTSLSSYRASGTHYAFAKPIPRIVDSIHHTRSHHSRLLQLADVYVYTLAMAAGDHSTYPRSEIVAHARDHGVLFPSKYKNWPTDRSWYQVSGQV